MPIGIVMCSHNRLIIRRLKHHLFSFPDQADWITQIAQRGHVRVSSPRTSSGWSFTIDFFKVNAQMHTVPPAAAKEDMCRCTQPHQLLQNKTCLRLQVLAWRSRAHSQSKCECTLQESCINICEFHVVEIVRSSLVLVFCSKTSCMTNCFGKGAGVWVWDCFGLVLFVLRFGFGRLWFWLYFDCILYFGCI